MHIADMTIGFTQRRQTVSEAVEPLILDQIFEITVDVRSKIVSEINYYFNFGIFASGRTARVGSIETANTFDHDVLFGFINPFTGDLEEARHLINGSKVLSSPLKLTIINDFNPEPLECFTIYIGSPDIPGDQSIPECFVDDDNSDSFFCEHEICIEDDDGLFRDICLDLLSQV